MLWIKEPRMECPACHKSQDPTAEVCEFCGIIFAKWFEIKTREMQSQIPLAALPPGPPPPPPQPKPEPAPPAAPLLEISPAEIGAYRVDPLLRTVFGFCLTALHPLVLWAHSLMGERVTLSPYVTLSVVCVGFGILIAMLAKLRNFSEILTSGGAGMLAGLLRAAFIYVVTIGTLTDKLKESMPVFAAYSFFTLLGGILAWGLRKFAGIKIE